MRGADLIAAARRRIEARLALPTKLETVDESIWLNVDSYSLLQAITYLASRLRDEFGIREVRFALEPAGALAHLDLIWTGAPLGSETTMSWQTDSMELGGEACPLTLKQIVERHNARNLVPDPQAVAPRVLPYRDSADQSRRRSRGARRPRARAVPSSTISTCSTSRGRRPSRTTGRSRR